MFPVRPVSTMAARIAFHTESSRWYALRWGELLDQVLRGDKRMTARQYANFLDHNYSVWANQLYGDLLTQTQVVTEAITGYLKVPTTPNAGAGSVASVRSAAVTLEGKRLVDLLAASRFHLVQRFWQVCWHPALFRADVAVDSQRVVDARVARTRIGLAREAVDLAEFREHLLLLRDAGHPLAALFLGSVNGTLAELDAALVLCELPRHHIAERVFVFPAPPAFESRAGRANSDFVLVDLAHQRGLGVQVKASRGRFNDKGALYDPERVTMLYSADDLDGFQLQTGAITPWPGTVSLRFMAVSRYEEMAHAHLSPDQFRVYKQRATALLPTRVSAAGQHMHDIARLADRARQATPARPARKVSEAARIRNLKQAERLKFERAVHTTYARIYEQLVAGSTGESGAAVKTPR